MTKKELLRIMRLLSAMESVMIAKQTCPDYLLDDLNEIVAMLEKEILA